MQLLIQLPILYALYRVIYAIPAYISQVRDAFFPLVDKLISMEGSAEFIQGFQNAAMYANRFNQRAVYVRKRYLYSECIYRCAE